MEIKFNYLINGKTVLFYGVLYENGEQFTHVVDGDEKFLVPMSPIKLINKSLLSYGSSFKGALESSKDQLGESKKMYPIKIDGSLDIWLFPTKSYKKDNCVWFALNHVRNSEPKGVKFTRVLLNYGHSIDMVMKVSAFREKRNTAKDLKDRITNNKNTSLTFFEEPKKGFMMVEKNGEYKCKVKNKESKDS